MSLIRMQTNKQLDNFESKNNIWHTFTEHLTTSNTKVLVQEFSEAITVNIIQHTQL